MAEIPLSLPGVPAWVRNPFRSISPSREAIRPAVAIDLFAKPGTDQICDRNFIRAFVETFQGSKAGAKKHFDVLSAMPQGYTFEGQIPDEPEHILRTLLADPELVIVHRGPVFDPKGKPYGRPHVVVGRRIIPTVAGVS